MIIQPTPKHLLLTAITTLSLVFTACDTTVNTDVAEVGEAIEKVEGVEANTFFRVDTTESEATWIASKITGQHNGVLQIKVGMLELHDSVLVGGKVLFNMTAVRSQDKSIDTESNNKLTTHLRSADFFNVERYPMAVFEIAGVVSFDSTSQLGEKTRKYSELRVKNPTHRLIGNLTIKGETKSVSFPARITMEGGELRAKANFNIDRTHWGLVYRADKSLGNQTIYPEVNIGLDILAKPVPPEQVKELK